MERFKLLASFSLLILLVGCAGIGQKNPENVGETHQGTQGIYFDFLPNYPPPIIYSSCQQPICDSGTNMVLEVKNLGSTSAGVSFFLSGFDTQIIKPGVTSAPVGSLEGKSTTNPTGGYAQVQFPPSGSLSISMPSGIDVYPATIQATACYDYQTKASLPVCVDPNPYSPITQEACVPHGATVGAGQGAPVAVSSVEQQSMNNKVIFKIHISNVGGGQVIRRGLYSTCTTLAYDKFNLIDTYSFKLGGGAGPGAGGTCTPAMPLRLVNNQATVTCVFNLPPGSMAYTTTLDVSMDYGYMSSKQRSIQVKKIS